MNWLRHEFSLRSMNCPKGVVVIKVYRHFDQVKRVEKSPKAKQYYNYSYHKQGDLSTTLEMTVLSQLILQGKISWKGHRQR